MADIEDRIDILDNDTLAFVSEIKTEDLRTLADHCAAICNSGKNISYGKDMTHVASVPEFLVKEFCNQRGVTWAQFMRDPRLADEFLAQPETQAFRTWKGRL